MNYLRSPPSPLFLMDMFNFLRIIKYYDNIWTPIRMLNKHFPNIPSKDPKLTKLKCKISDTSFFHQINFGSVNNDHSSLLVDSLQMIAYLLTSKLHHHKIYMKKKIKIIILTYYNHYKLNGIICLFLFFYYISKHNDTFYKTAHCIGNCDAYFLQSTCLDYKYHSVNNSNCIIVCFPLNK